MPKYLIEMHDGRKFQVEADSQPSEADVLAKLGESSKPAANVVSPDEPGTYIGGFAKSVRETIGKTGAGVLEGLNPLNMLKGIWEGRNDALPFKPEETQDEATARLKAHDVVNEQPLSDPETGGRAIGNLLLGEFIGRGAAAAKSVSVSPLARKAAAKLLKYGSTAAGAHVAGAPGAIVGSVLGEDLADAILQGRVAPPGPSDPSAPHMDRSIPVRPSELTKEQLAERILQPGKISAEARAKFDAAKAARKGPIGVTQQPAIAEPVAEPIAAPEAAAAAKQTASAPEVKEYFRLRAAGKTDAEAQDAIQAARAMNAQFGLIPPTVAQTKFPKGMRGGAPR